MTWISAGVVNWDPYSPEFWLNPYPVLRRVRETMLRVSVKRALQGAWR